MCFHAVPPPTLNITGPPQLVVYEGTNGTLTCHILVISTIDTEVNVSAEWVKDGEEVASSNRISISEISRNELSNHEYQFSLSISPFSNSADPGHYTSKVTITPTENSNYISAAETSEAYLLSVAGIQPLPLHLFHNVWRKNVTITSTASLSSQLWSHHRYQ